MTKPATPVQLARVLCLDRPDLLGEVAELIARRDDELRQAFEAEPLPDLAYLKRDREKLAKVREIVQSWIDIPERHAFVILDALADTLELKPNARP